MPRDIFTAKKPNHKDSYIFHNPDKDVEMFETDSHHLSLLLPDNSETNVKSKKNYDGEDLKNIYLVVWPVEVKNVSLIRLEFELLTPI